MKYYFLCNLAWLLTLVAQAQVPDASDANLVVNYSFEEAATDSTTFARANDLATAKGWTTPNEASPKLYSTTRNGNIYDEYGSAWPFKARSGKHVAAIRVYGGAEDAPLREYIQGSLREPLTVGQTYEFSFWVHYHCEGANNIGIVFLPRSIQLAGDGLIELAPAAYQTEVTPYSRGRVWTEVKGTFVAYQPYANFLLGNFFDNAATQLESNRYNHHLAYLDDIVVRPLTTTAPPDSTAEQAARQWTANLSRLQALDKRAGADDPTSLIVTNFPQGGAALPSAALPALRELAEQLMSEPNKQIVIYGYASSEGTEAINLRVAQRRCQAVASFLAASGVAESQIRTVARGEQDPIADNATTAGRKQNRRVEIMVE
jgi:outer membrane protein OmpA-like peptidoglycan-associated protein